MNKCILILASLFIFINSFSQNYCGSSRYDTVVFTAVTTTSNVVYGWNKDFNNTMDTLKMDVYQPAGDAATQRPLIVMAHGGSFVAGSKTDAALISLCTAFAMRGYVTASIDYRLGISFPDSVRAISAVWRAVQDMKAAVRFFRKDAATANTFRVDSNMIFIGGASAGGIMAVHYAYLDKPSEIPATIDTIALGGMEGNSGNAGYSSSVKAIINICGAIIDTCWMQPGDAPMASLQGNNDNTVPYCSNMVYLAIFPITVMHGSGTMVKRANHIGLMNPIHTFYGQGHTSPGSAGNIDTSIIVVSDFLYRQLGCNPTNTVVYTNAPVCLANLANTPSCSTSNGVSNIVLNNEYVSLYPDPVAEKFTLALKNVKGTKFFVQIFDMTGRVVKEISFAEKDIVVMRNNMKGGLYFLKMTSDAGELFVTKMAFSE